MSSFFTSPASQRKRKRQDAGPTASIKRRNTSSSAPRARREKPRRDRSESISGSESSGDEDGQNVYHSPETSEDERENETAAEKRLRLAEQYLDNIRAEVDEAGFDAEEVDRDIIAARLKEDVAESKGKVYRHIASGLDFDNVEQTFFRADQKHITAVACCAPYIYICARDMSIVKWEMPSVSSKTSRSPDEQERGLLNGSTAEEKLHTGTNYTAPRRPKKVAFARGRRSKQPSYTNHTASILCAAASTTGRFLATGGLDRRIIIWDVSAPSSLKAVKVFTQHRDAVTGLAFRRNTNQLYSCSRDRTVKVWSLDELAYVETLFGHQDAVVDIAAGMREQCVSAGARDKTARLWKVAEETQLVFRGGGLPGRQMVKGKDRGISNGHANGGFDDKEQKPERLHAEGSIDRVALVDDETFVTGSDNGAICLWNIHKKKPVAVVPLAHGLDSPIRLEDAYAEERLEGRKRPSPPNPRWITALTTLPYSDVVVSGSWDGTIKAWKVREDRRGLDALGIISSGPAIVDGLDSESNGAQPKRKSIVGIINGICIFERGERGKEGVVIVAGLDSKPRLGNWSDYGGKSTAVLFSVSRRAFNVLPNGISGHAEEGGNND